MLRLGKGKIPDKNKDGAAQGWGKRSRLWNFHGMGPDLPPVALPSRGDGIPGCSRGRKEGREGIPVGFPQETALEPGSGEVSSGIFVGEFFFPSLSRFSMDLSVDQRFEPALMEQGWNEIPEGSQFLEFWNSGLGGRSHPDPNPGFRGSSGIRDRGIPTESSHGGAKDIPTPFSQGKELDPADRGSFPS